MADCLSDLRFTLVAPEFLSRRARDLQISWKKIYGTCLEASFVWHTHCFRLVCMFIGCGLSVSRDYGV